jgi:pimeloyl-ACP methyl ester carboxylesterase
MTRLFVTSKDERRIAYDVAGSGPAVMLLHGAGKTRRDWHKVGYVGRLAEDFTVISVDIRGSGDSDWPSDITDYAIETICQDLEAVADACEVTQFGVWGFSFGGCIARYLGAWSDRVTAIAVIGAPFGPAVDGDFDRSINQLVKKWGPLVEAYNQGTLDKDTPQKERKPITSGKIPAWLACFQAMRAWPDVAPGDVRCATMLLFGTQNKRVTAWVAANREALDEAGTQIETIAGLNHRQEFSQIDQVFPIVCSFFKAQAD